MVVLCFAAAVVDFLVACQFLFPCQSSLVKGVLKARKAALSMPVLLVLRLLICVDVVSMKIQIVQQ